MIVDRMNSRRQTDGRVKGIRGTTDRPFTQLGTCNKVLGYALWLSILTPAQTLTTTDAILEDLNNVFGTHLSLVGVDCYDANDSH